MGSYTLLVYIIIYFIITVGGATRSMEHTEFICYQRRQKDRKCKYKITLRSVRVTIVVVEK